MHKNLEFPITIRKRMNRSNMILSTKMKTSESIRGKKVAISEVSSIDERHTGTLTMAKLADPSGSSNSEDGSIDDECSISLAGNCFFMLSLCMSLRDA